MLLICILLIVLAGSVMLNLATGYMELSFADFLMETQSSALVDYRVHRVITVSLGGMMLSVCGFLLQEYFQNPLAGPSVLGITSSASLFVALYIFLSANIILPAWFADGSIAFAGIIGSLFLMFLLIGFGKFQTDRNYLIIFGFLISALSGALISVIQFYYSNQGLKNFVFWNYGANDYLNGTQLLWLLGFAVFGLTIALRTIRPLIGTSLGTNYARSMGIDTKKLRLNLILSSSILAASVTSFMGPVLFIGIIVPHFSRMLWNPAKLWEQLCINVLIGMIVLTIFSTISTLTFLPINIMTSVFGIPVILMMMLSSKKNIPAND